MRRFWGAAVAACAALAAGMAATLPTTMGASLLHYNVAFAVTLALAALFPPVWRHRRAATFAMGLTGAVATATGFMMVYTKDFPYKDWLTWWHSVTSVAFLVAFLAHWLHNRTRLWDFTRRLFARRIAGPALAAAWVGMLAFGAWTGTADVRPRFTRENYFYVVSWTVWAGVAFTYGLWLAYRLPALRARLAVREHRTRVRALVDVSLFVANWGALLTGFALLYFADFLRGGDFKYVSKWWHTATSVAFLALVVLHVGFNARLVAAHARRIDKEMRS